MEPAARRGASVSTVRLSRVLCIIPARGGSQRLPGKNLAHVCGISLVGRAVRVARAFLGRAGVADGAVIVDTDDPAIAAEGRRWGGSVPFLRAPALASSDASSIEATLGLLDRITEQGETFGTVVLIQPTSPLRTSDDLLACWNAFDGAKVPSVVSLVPARYPADLYLTRDEECRVDWVGGAPASSAKTPEDRWQLNGAVYIADVAWLRSSRTFVSAGETIGVEMPSTRSVDVDVADDLALARAVAAGDEPAAIEIGGRPIGGGAPCFIIAEAGVNHNGDLSLAHQLVDVAADSGADAIKFQTFDPDLVAGTEAPKAEYQMERTDRAEDQREMLRRLALPPDAFRILAAHAARRGILFMSTAFDTPSLRLLDELNVPALKVPSGEITNLSFLQDLARRGKPLLVSTGMCELAEVALALDTIAASGNPPVALLHCVSSYPARAEDCNLRAMKTMERVFAVPTGWSDHTEGVVISLAAVSMGAAVLEKHFTLDRTLPGPDHEASLAPQELEALVRGVRLIEAARGTGEKVPTAEELATARVARRSVHFARPVEAGATIDEADLTLLRPGTGFAPSLVSSFVGQRVVRDAIAGEILTREHFHAE